MINDLEKLTPEELNILGRGESSNMSPQGICRRLDITSQIVDLSLTFRIAKRLGPAEAVDDPNQPSSRDVENANFTRQQSRRHRSSRQG